MLLLATYEVDICILLSLSLIAEIMPTWYSAVVFITMQDCPFIQRQGWSSVLLIGLGLFLGANTYRYPTIASVVPSTCL